MDLVTFNDGVQNVTVYDSASPTALKNNTRPTPFALLGEPVERHTDRVFSADTSFQGLLNSLASAESNISFDPATYYAWLRQTKQALLDIYRRLSRSKGNKDAQHQSVSKNALHNALMVINELENDLDLLVDYQRALEKA